MAYNPMLYGLMAPLDDARDDLGAALLEAGQAGDETGVSRLRQELAELEALCRQVHDDAMRQALPGYGDSF